MVIKNKSVYLLKQNARYMKVLNTKKGKVVITWLKLNKLSRLSNFIEIEIDIIYNGNADTLYFGTNDNYIWISYISNGRKPQHIWDTFEELLTILIEDAI